MKKDVTKPDPRFTNRDFTDLESLVVPIVGISNHVEVIVAGIEYGLGITLADPKTGRAVVCHTPEGSYDREYDSNFFVIIRGIRRGKINFELLKKISMIGFTKRTGSSIPKSLTEQDLQQHCPYRQ